MLYFWPSSHCWFEFFDLVPDFRKFLMIYIEKVVDLIVPEIFLPEWLPGFKLALVRVDVLFQ